MPLTAAPSRIKVEKKYPSSGAEAVRVTVSPAGMAALSRMGVAFSPHTAHRLPPASGCTRVTV